jgi:acylphosphatase
MKNKIRAHAIVRGRVQGVFFRMETKRAADRFGVGGWVRNLKDGTVEAVFEGDQNRVEAALDWCRQGPSHAAVADVDVTFHDYTGEFDGFRIVYLRDF